MLRLWWHALLPLYFYCLAGWAISSQHPVFNRLLLLSRACPRRFLVARLYLPLDFRLHATPDVCRRSFSRAAVRFDFATLTASLFSPTLANFGTISPALMSLQCRRRGLNPTSQTILFVSLVSRSCALDSVDKGGGETAAYVRDGFSASLLAYSSERYCSQPEYMLVRVSAIGLRPFLLAIVYQSPKLDYLINFQHDCERYLSSFPAVVINHFNIDLNCQSFDSTSLLDFCQSNHLYIVPFTSTHQTATSHSRIDHCFISNRSFVLSTLTFFSLMPRSH